MAKSSSIQIKNIRKTFLQTTESPNILQKTGLKPKGKSRYIALNKMSADIKRGSFTTIFGPNGSGKSTLFKIIAGLDSPTSGQITIDNKPVQNARIGFVFQNYRDSMLTWRTAVGNVELALEANNIPKEKRRKIALDYLKRVNIDHIANKPFYELSGGQAQLVSIARSFAYEPDILLMDEPFSALDFQTSIRMMKALSKLWQETNITTLFISHDVDEAVFLADQVMVLTSSPGRVQKMVSVSLKRPRPTSLLTSKKFFDIRANVLEEFRKGSQK